MARTPRHTSRRTAEATPVGPFETDQDLGIGQELDGPDDRGNGEKAGDDLAALMSHPALQAAIDAAVAQRLAQLGAPVASAVPASSEAFQAFTATLKHLIESQTMQMPGYQKPLSADEMDRRAKGHIEMRALLKECEAKGRPPLWEVGEGGFFECTNALEFIQGQQIRTYLPPAEGFVPLNAEAEAVHAAMMVWIGGPTPHIGDQVEAAKIAASQAPLVTGALQPARRPGLVEVVADVAPTTTKPQRRSMGSIVPERREISMAERAAGPAGPVFIGAEA